MRALGRTGVRDPCGVNHLGKTVNSAFQGWCLSRNRAGSVLVSTFRLV